ncbi:hypothetical protein A8C58_00430 [Enterococcus faecium]|nr:hypothetical protein A8C58_00430 [Enterococcus faecium]
MDCCKCKLVVFYFQKFYCVSTLKSDYPIIFGIDQDEIDPNLDIYRFTKTFRQMTETKLAVIYQENILPDKETVNEIVFFGHSLSLLDYSYF